MSDATEIRNARHGPDSAGTISVGPSTLEPGAHSHAEILSQPDCWQACLAEFAQSPSLKEVESRFGGGDEWLFIGCGSSYYVALAAAATMKSVTGRRARAIPASELLLYPELVFSASPFVPVLISRSGLTSEVLKAAETLRDRNIPNFAISCAQGQLLEKLATLAITVPADEQSTVMTRSFTSMLLALQFLAGRISGNVSYCNELLAIPAAAKPPLMRIPDRIRDFVAAHPFTNYVCLGQGPFYGLACEYG
ncbi:MAG TPA: SIS domain-containing protein, partial [Terriglobales bacterium]